MSSSPVSAQDSHLIAAHQSDPHADPADAAGSQLDPCPASDTHTSGNTSAVSSQVVPIPAGSPLLSLAPMEGVTGHVFRRAHAKCFGKLDRYYAPFVAPPRVRSGFGGRARAELDPQHNLGLDVVPQLLTRNADEFVWAARLLAEMGYREVNLNVGCPSNIVVAKGKGAGFLRDLDGLEAFLLDVCRRSPIPVSVKTRVGVNDDAEYSKILEMYCRLPLAELIVHPRVQQDRYQGKPRAALYGETLARAPFPVAYNGDVFACADMGGLLAAYPRTRHVMLGRGLLANPALARILRGGSAATLAELRRFHSTLYLAYKQEMGVKAAFRMKEWWSYIQYAFTDPAAVHRRVREVRTIEEYEDAVEAIFTDGTLAAIACYQA